VLEDGRVRRLGETRDRQVDVRVLAATHRDLEVEVSSGIFRQDLYFRLAHLPIQVPALRERQEDVALLFNHFVDCFADQYRLRRKAIDPEMLPPLERHAWPGNVRELRNLAERLTVFGGDPLTLEDLPSAFQQERPEEAAETGVLRLAGNFPVVPLKTFKTETEREYLEAVLRRTGWNISAAAKLLDIQRTHLHQKIAALGIHRPKRAEVEVVVALNG
jgi:two-component system nitrogen regulation response regulator NtrX